MHGSNLCPETERSYRILELDEGASRWEVDQSWRKLVDEWAPDRFVGDAVMVARAELRVKSLNEAREILTRQLSDSPKVIDKRPKYRSPVRRTWSIRSLRWGASTLAVSGAAVAILLARPSFGVKPTPAPVNGAPAAEAVTAPSTKPTPPVANEQIILVARAPVTVSVSQVADGRILLAETTLQAGQTLGVGRTGPIYVKYSAGENLELEIYGRRYPVPDTGPSRAKIN